MAALVRRPRGTAEAQLPGHVTAYRCRGPPPLPPYRCGILTAMDSAHVEKDLVDVLFTEAQIQERVG